MQNLPYIFLAILLQFLHKESLSHKHEGNVLTSITLSLKKCSDYKYISHPSNLIRLESVLEDKQTFILGFINVLNNLTNRVVYSFYGFNNFSLRNFKIKRTI